MGQLAEIDVHRSPKAIPTRKSLLLFALDVPKGIADALKIESHTALREAGALATPLPEEVPVRSLSRLLTVRTAPSFPLCRLGNGRRCPHQKAQPQSNEQFE